MNKHLLRALSWIARNVEDDDQYAEAIGYICRSKKMIVEVLACSYDIDIDDTYAVEQIEGLVKIAMRSAKKNLSALR